MLVDVLGCHGGETPRHKTSAFLLDGRLALDAGALASMLTIEEQCALEAVVVSHAHLDHVRDLAGILDNRVQSGAGLLRVYAPAETIAVLKAHFFNGLLWPDFTRIPSVDAPSLALLPLAWEQPESLLDGAFTVTAVPVTHTIDCAGFVVAAGRAGAGGAALGYTGDTGPTDRFWEVLDATPNVRLLLAEVSLPESQGHLARLSGHHTPTTLANDLEKLRVHSRIDTLIYHIKPVFEAETHREIARVLPSNVHIPKLGDRFRL